MNVTNRRDKSLGTTTRQRQNPKLCTNLEKICKSRLPLGFHPGQVHSGRKIVDKPAVDVQDDGLRERRHEHVADLLLFVPVPHALCQGYAEEGMALEDFGQAVEKSGYLRAAQDGRAALFQGLLVVLRETRHQLSFESLVINMYLRSPVSGAWPRTSSRCARWRPRSSCAFLGAGSGSAGEEATRGGPGAGAAGGCN